MCTASKPAREHVRHSNVCSLIVYRTLRSDTTLPVAIVGVRVARIFVNSSSISHILACRLISEGWIGGIMPKGDVILMKLTGQLPDLHGHRNTLLYCAHEETFVFFFAAMKDM